VTVIGTIGGASSGTGGHTQGLLLPSDTVRGLGQLAPVPPGHVGFASDDLGTYFTVLMNDAGATVTGGGPKHTISERIWRSGVPEYQGHDPITLSISLLLDGWPSVSVQGTLGLLRALYKRLPDEARVPTIRITGPVPYPDLTWVADGAMQWDTTPARIIGGTGFLRGQLLRQAITVNVIEHVKDTLLQESITQSTKTGRGSRAKTVTVKAGETNLGDVSKRVYGTRNRAGDLARANTQPVGARVHSGQKLRLPQ
jgi:hypothetical protein